MAKNKDNHNARKSQAGLKIPGERIINLIPDEWETIMREHGAFTRSRVVRSGKEQLQAGMLYVLGEGGMRVLASHCADNGRAMSDNGWRGRILRMKEGAEAIIKHTLSQRVGVQIAKDLTIALVDGSDVLGASGKCIHRMHVAMDLGSQRIMHMRITDNHTAEAIPDLASDSHTLNIADAGYGRTKQVQAAMAQGDVLIRFSPHHLNLYDENGVKVDLLSQIQSTGEAFERTYHLDKAGSMSIRMIASAIPPEHHNKIDKRKIRKSLKSGHKPKAATLAYGKWMFLLTTLGPQYDIERIVALYRMRWQIEIMFKSMKQTLPFDKLKACKQEMGTVLLYILVLLWLLYEKYWDVVSQSFAQCLERRISPKILATRFFRILLAQLLIGIGVIRVSLNLPALLALMDHKSSRVSFSGISP